ncbi:hypothetical protein WHR41_09368 [Cladosporium halotolerans]|uniref:CENP-V/GFA domain-containing protein n=1 Tax=Cladosporium halotolerans TaxID=1052096 RepID=A0AB34KDH2_9PEZI
MSKLNGGCTCGLLRYTLNLPGSSDDARTTLCHCHSCKRAFGGAFGLTAKTAKDNLKYTTSTTPKIFVQDNGVHREFCGECGVFISEYGEQAKNDFRYLCVGTLDDGSNALPPKGEFFTSQRDQWMPQVPDIFHKKEIKN